MNLPLEHLKSLFKALADPTRLRIVHLLDGRNLCVWDLQQVFGCSQPFISRHLAVLRAAKLVCPERRGNQVCYSLSRALPLSHSLEQFLKNVVAFFPELQGDVQRLGELGGLGMLKTGDVPANLSGDCLVSEHENEACKD